MRGGAETRRNRRGSFADQAGMRTPLATALGLTAAEPPFLGKNADFVF